MQSITLDSRQLCDLDLLLNGSFHPVNSFMNSKDYHSVLENMHLSNGALFPLPIILSTDLPINLQDKIQLVDKYNYPIASLLIEDIYSPDVEKECNAIYGCCDDNHPYIKQILERKDSKYISGKLTRINGVSHFDYQELLYFY